MGLYLGSVFIFATIYLDSWARIFLFKEPEASKSPKKSSGTKTDLADTNTTGAHDV
jgi:hypothetical protein